MQSLLILIPIAIVFVIIAIAIFFWAVKSGQYEDLDTEARRILFEDDSATTGVKPQPPATDRQSKSDDEGKLET